MATTYDSNTVVVELPSLVVRRSHMLLPAARHHLDIVENDDVPDVFFDASVDEAAATTLAAALIGNRTAPNIQWKFSAAPLLGTASQWESWISLLLKEAYRNCPMSAQTQERLQTGVHHR